MLLSLSTCVAAGLLLSKIEVSSKFWAVVSITFYSSMVAMQVFFWLMVFGG